MSVEMGGTKFEGATGANRDLPLINPSNLNFEGSSSFVNRTARFVLLIPNLGEDAELLVFPEGDAKAGQPMKQDESGNTERGIVFFNGKDSAWQAVRANGEEAILINDISKEDAHLLKQKLDELAARGGGTLTLEEIKNVLDFARNDLGLIDFYNKKMSSVSKDMAPVDQSNTYYMTVTKATQHQAVFVEQPFSFDGPVQQQYPNGAVLVTDGKFTWGVATDVFLRNFKRVDGDVETSLASTEELLRLQ